ncbi:MAG: hypothetical protein L3K01_00810 [Thermoplasmata archaeon]|nr:hypothetical protein [Thermoplasmata archaeon]MCI4367681.1 hypothetical protein [Thermoplasmata archaeon]
MPIRRRWGAGALAGLLVLVVALSMLPLPAPEHAAPWPSGVATSARVASSCAGAPLSPLLNGSLGVEGNRTPRPIPGNATVSVRYLYQTNQSSKFGTTLSCSSNTLQLRTNATGGFAVNLTLPGTSCGPTGCLTYLGPFGPVTFRVTTGQAPAYFLTTHWSGSLVALDWVDALASATTTPSQFATLSVGARTTVTGAGWDGAGVPSTANLTYEWSLVGTGWTGSGVTNASDLFVTAAIGAGPGTITLWLNGSYNGTVLDLPAIHLYLTAAATTIARASMLPTELDVGTEATVTVHATGAYGYAYSANLTPGLGVSAESSRCSVLPASGGFATVSCTLLVEYPTAGSAQPTVNVTNGYSASSDWQFPNVVVSNALAVDVGPSPAQAYPGVPVRIDIRVAPETGTAPFGPACLLTGDGRFVCDLHPGPNWTISATYATLGSYPALVTVADGSGTNRTVSVPVDVVPRPTSPVVELTPSSVGRNTSVVASAQISGGAFPMSYWWNASGPETLYSGVVESDAIPSVAFQSASTGTKVVTLTVVDALGTVESGSATVVVLGGPARALELSAPAANGTVAAGTPVAIALWMVDGYGERTPAIPGFVTLHFPAACGAVWVNTSGGPMAPGANGDFLLPSGAGSSGALNLTVAVSRSGTCPVQFTGPPSVAGGANVTIDVASDAHHVLLVSPREASAGGGRSATLYSLVDRFGNPQTSGFVEVRSVFPGGVNELDSPVRSGPSGGSVWVNFTSTGPGPGTGYVISEFNQSLLGPLAIPAPPTTSAISSAELLGLGAVGLLAVVVGVALVARRRRPLPSGTGSDDPEEPDEPLRRLAEGRSHVLARLSYDRDTDLDGVAAGFPGRAPDAAELAEWVGTLVTEGLVAPIVGPDGRPQFRLANPESASPGPRVEVDPLALDAALARRDRDAEEPDGPVG